MKIDLRSKANKKSVSSVRSQIKDKGDLKKFDEFIAKHEVFDVSNDNHMKAAQTSSPPQDKCNDIFTPSIKLN